MTQISDEELVDALQELATELDDRPGTQDMEDQGAFGASTYYRRFGSWNAALEAAGLKTATPQNAVISDKTLIDELRRLANDLERRPSENDMREHGMFSPEPYRRRFGSWPDALSELEKSSTSEP